MTVAVLLGLGRVTQLSPLQVRLNGDKTPTPAFALSDFTGAAVGAASGTEVLVFLVESRRFAERVRL